MSKMVLINPSHGGSDIGNQGSTIKESDYTLKMAKEIQKYLNSKGIMNQLVRSKDETISEENRIQKIVGSSPNNKDTVVVTLSMDSPSNQEIEIIYALRNTNQLASRIAVSLEDAGYTVSKYYQRRLPSNTSQDYDNLIRNTGNRETILIEYGNLSNQQFIQNNWENLALKTAEAIATYLGEVGNYYTVQAGDTLYSIARKFGVSLEELQKANNLGTNLLSLGQKLLIPEKKEDDLIEPDSAKTIYVVKSGDTIYGIARAYGITVEELKKFNQLQNNILSIGQKLVIPESNNLNTITYVVKSGDSLYSIATRYGISVVDLKNANGLTSNLLSINQKLLIPVKKGGITYTVQKGDNLYTIAQKYGVSVDSIKKANGLTSNLLSIGEKLMIPES